jgi:hypothetical protein
MKFEMMLLYSFIILSVIFLLKYLVDSNREYLRLIKKAKNQNFEWVARAIAENNVVVYIAGNMPKPYSLTEIYSYNVYSDSFVPTNKTVMYEEIREILEGNNTFFNLPGWAVKSIETI